MKHATTVRVALVAGFFIMLEALARFGIVSKRSIVPPSEMVTRLADLMQHKPFWDQLTYTAVSIVVALSLAVILGFIGGAMLHRLPRTRRALEPLIASYYALPFFVLYPLFIVLWGMNAIPIIFVGFIYAVMAMLTATLSGLDRIPAVFRRAGSTFQLSPWREAALIQLPAAAPYLLTGIKLALGYAITGVIGSEFILSNNGLGYAIAYAYNAFDDRTMYALLLFLIVLVTIITILLHTAERTAHHRSGAIKIEEHKASLRERTIATFLVLIVLFAGWELLNWKVGDEALAAPGATFQRLGEFLSGGTDFWANVAADLLRRRHRLRRHDRPEPCFYRNHRADPRHPLCAAEGHALSRSAAVLRHRTIREDRFRRALRHDSDDPDHHQCHRQHESSIGPCSTNDEFDATAEIFHVDFAGHAA
jgi:ABC-type nitrate/sulfonate/bicarbonate transport system permease component